MKRFLLNALKGIPSTIQLVLAITTLVLTYNIGKEQNVISSLQYSPVFIFNIEQLFRKDYTPTQSEKFEIINEGYPVNNFYSDIDSIMEITFYFKGEFHRNKLKIDYFSVQSRKSGGKERMSGGIGENNISMFSSLKSKLQESLTEKGAKQIAFSFEHLTKISYSDMDQVESEMYFLNSERVKRDVYVKSLEGVDRFYIVSLYEPNVDEITSKLLLSN
ncbi:hypothetical protein [Candidatus Pantoea multigeneris]|uniref:Uncharacterized protein n=1 Tax=Candidatus Pantoea multigeneris TaxID=2608357 RepID=A0ABX0R9N6_9GAMM|nr:hypothetical protein [Pantoea multigeneris]NIF21056.1 hypothetical protein [Pantoea multigeneris]